MELQRKIAVFFQCLRRKKMGRAANESPKVSADDRAAHYRRMAKEVDRSAVSATTSHMRASYVALAQAWRALADAVEADAAKMSRWEMIDRATSLDAALRLGHRSL